MNESYTKEPAFINRKKELQFLHEHITKRPENMLFIYGPKSSGKTTLLYKFVDDLKKSKTQKYKIFHHNLRRVSISRYEDFLRTFFYVQDETLPAQTTSVSVSLGFVTINQETARQMAQHNVEPFDVIRQEFELLNKKGIRPIVIIDELQALEAIYMNDQRELLKEIFNFFVAMTKESHLCHVLIASSDGYFIERIFEDSKLKKTSFFFEVPYLSKEDTIYWLNNLQKESAIKEYMLSENQKEQVWDFFGGSCWEVSNFLGNLQSGAKDGCVPQEYFEQLLEKEKIAKRSLFVYYAYKRTTQELFKQMNKIVNKNQKIQFNDLFFALETIYSEKELLDELKTLLSKNFLAFNPTTAEYGLQGRSMEIGLEEFAKMLEKK